MRKLTQGVVFFFFLDNTGKQEDLLDYWKHLLVDAIVLRANAFTQTLWE